jgi:hypothetical protein
MRSCSRTVGNGGGIGTDGRWGAATSGAATSATRSTRAVEESFMVEDLAGRAGAAF